MKRILSICLTATLAASAMAAGDEVNVRIIETSDVHGSFVAHDFISQQPRRGTLARACTYVKAVREEYGDNLLLLENGDILQGQPICYYYNYVATDEENVAAAIVNYMGYDIQNFGNHDIETGHAVYDKWVGEIDGTVLGANITDTSTGRPYVEPYKIFERGGMKIAVLGMLTPAIPNWLDEYLWSGLRFENMVDAAKKWVRHLKEVEKADIVIGLFHAGRNGGIVTDEYEENPTERIAREVPGFDAILYGHDHTKYCGTVTNTEGEDVWILNPANNALNVAELDLTFDTKAGKVVAIDGRIVNIEDQPIDKDFEEHFDYATQKVKDYVGRKIGHFTKPMSTRDSFFGNSAFTDFIQNLQLQMTGADISFNAPLQFDATIGEGDLHVSDMFSLYKYENLLCVVRMTGREILRHLEMSYDMWVNTMESPDDHIMQLSEYTKDDRQRYGFKNLTFNFDSAAGIDYVVDVTKPDGEKVQILQLSDGRPFDLDAEYKVAMNSYRASGGGELLTRGAGIGKEELRERVIYQSDRDLRHYLMQEIERLGTVTPEANSNWRFVPEEWARPAIERDRRIIFGE